MCEGFRCDFLKTRISNDQPVYGHKIVLIGHFVYVWGGSHHDRDRNRMWSLNIRNNTWRVQRVKNKSKAGSLVDIMFVKDDLIYALSYLPFMSASIFVEIDAIFRGEVVPVHTRNPPTLISGCRGAFLEETQELVAIEGNASVHVLSCLSFQWTRPKTTGYAPSRLGDMACCSYGKTLYITGHNGNAYSRFFLLILTAELTSFRWSRPKSYYLGPHCRAGVTLTCSSPHRIFLFGGTGYWTEANVYNAVDGKWMNLANTANDMEMECFGDRRGGTWSHAALQTKDFLLVIGGYGNHYWLSSPLKLTPLRNR